MYDYDVQHGKLSNRRNFIEAKELGYSGFCDGMCVDADGGWSPMFTFDYTVKLTIHTCARCIGVWSAR